MYFNLVPTFYLNTISVLNYILLCPFNLNYTILLIQLRHRRLHLSLFIYFCNSYEEQDYTL